MPVADDFDNILFDRVYSLLFSDGFLFVQATRDLTMEQ